MEENNKGTVIAEKSNKFTVLEAIGAVISISVAVFGFVIYCNMQITYILIFVAVTLGIGAWALCLTIGNINKPKVLIEDFGDRIVIYQSGGKQTELRFADIDSFVAQPMHAKGITYKFGNLLIYAQGEKFKVGVMKDVDKVEKKLYTKIAYKFKY